MQDTFYGVIPPVPTVFDDHNEFDAPGMAMLLDKLINDGATGLLILGSGGEFCHLSSAQRCHIAAFCLQHVNHRVPVLVGIGAPGTQESIDIGRHAQEHGADAVLAINPYYAKISDEGMYQHYKHIASAIGIPVFLYNFPALSGQDIGINTIIRLAKDCPNIVGIKDTIDNISHIRALINQVRPVREDFIIFSGYDEYLMDTLILGGNGGIPATFNFMPELTRGIYQRYLQGDYQQMLHLHRQVSQLSDLYELDTPFFSVIKEAIRYCGCNISTQVLPPSLPLSADKKARLFALIDTVKQQQ